MALDYQSTLGNTFSFEGKGIHLGTFAIVYVCPLPVDTGIVFQKLRNNSESKQYKLSPKLIDNTNRSTNLKLGNEKVNTVEHLLSALWTMGIDNALIQVDGDEIPILDGSAKLLCDLIVRARILKQEKIKKKWNLQETLHFEHEETGANYEILPSENFEVELLLDYEFDKIGKQFASFNRSVHYLEEISSARTFSLYSEIKNLLSNKRIKGGDLNNAVVFIDEIPKPTEVKYLSELLGISPQKVKGLGSYQELRYSNEPARHKLLDFLGDLAVLGMRINAKIIAKKPGHTANAKLVEFLNRHFIKHYSSNSVPLVDFSKKPEMEQAEIQRMLPHRFPFLLVDKIIELTEEYIIGLKNVTLNESFFQGHFPGNPIFPGVLLIEAMAQTGGILALSKMNDPENWDTYFAKIENIRFRKKVVPGDSIIMKLTLTAPIKRGIVKMNAKAFVGDKIVADGDLTAQIVNRKKV